MLDQKKKLALAQLESVITGDKFTETMIKIETEKLNDILNSNGTGLSIEQSLVHLSKWIGYFIKTKEISVKEFFDLTKEFERVNKTEYGKKDRK